MSLCTHGVQTGEGYECSSCVTTPTFEEQRDAHLQRLAAERAPIEERIEDGMCAGMPLPVGDTVPRCGHFAAHHPHRIGESVAYRWPEERTGVSDVRAEVRKEVEALRSLLQAHAADRVDPERYNDMFWRLHRIEQHLRGER